MELTNDAWLGDAVLALWVRQRLLAAQITSGQERGALFTRLTSNQFLSSRGRPTEVEARIGRIYRTQGLAPAFTHLEDLIGAQVAKTLGEHHATFPGVLQPNHTRATIAP